MNDIEAFRSIARHVVEQSSRTLRVFDRTLRYFCVVDLTGRIEFLFGADYTVTVTYGAFALEGVRASFDGDVVAVQLVYGASDGA